ncbi:MAG TPA: hypothetical protein VF246_10210 [Acidimicrobiia bacterium]|jgi:hypothetical protein|nr:hypothetical protein [uncultured bacterium]
MASYDAKLRIEGTQDPPIHVVIDLTDDRMVVTAGDVEVADWSRDEIRIAALLDGFHVRAEGEEVVLDIRDDAKFAVELGLRQAHPYLRRRIAALLREQESAGWSPEAEAAEPQSNSAI